MKSIEAEVTLRSLLRNLLKASYYAVVHTIYIIETIRTINGYLCLFVYD